MDLKTLIPELNRRILRLAPKYEVSEQAPQTYAELTDAYRKRGIITVWSGASDQTIYGDANVNFAMRAWHDALHIELGADFSLAGETRVALKQAELIGDAELAKILMAEVLGQVEYYHRHGQFPIDQHAFVSCYLKNKQLAISLTF